MARTQRGFERGALPDLGARVPPHNLEAEESVLGACLLSREAVANILEIVHPHDFYKPAHVELFDAILELYGRGEPVDAVTLGEELRRRDRLEDIGGKAYLHTLVAAVPTAGSAVHYARIVEEHAILRRLIEASQEISDLAFNLPEDVEETVDRAENLIYQVSQRRLTEDFRVLKDLLAENMEQVEKLYERGSSITGLPTGFSELDNITAGLQPANLIIVAARPSQGKSSLAISIAEHVGVNEQVPVVVFSLEMSKMELVQRLMCSEARVDSNRLRRGALQDSDWPKLSHALGRLAEAPLFIDDTPNVTIMEMRAKCRRLKSKHGLGLVIVDYLQLMQPSRRTDNRVQEVTEISRNLKILAREMDVPVIAVSQLSRNVEYRADKRPLLADLRESGCLTGETRVALASGDSVPISSLVGSQPEVVTLDGWRVATAKASKVWKTGTKPVLKLTTATGRSVSATANHPFRTLGEWRRLDELNAGDQIALPQACTERGATFCDTPLGLGRNRQLPNGYATTLKDEYLKGVANSDVYWDRVVSIEPDGVEDVYDMTVVGTHNFVANGVIAHNSLEQDSDLVLFI
ncbi:MAG: replicative DNA helicase, partial [Acidimicrobiia bacterium]